MYHFTQNWFRYSEIARLLLGHLDPARENHILEIGSYEGQSSVFFADNLLEHSKSTLTCVDPFLNVEDNDHRDFLQNQEERNFDHNISVCKNSEKISIQKITSDEFFEKVAGDACPLFNFIYIDGCHSPDFITRDMENSFRVLEKNGIMWMDDYLGGDRVSIKNAMDAFLERHRGEYEIIHSGYQLAIRSK